MERPVRIYLVHHAKTAESWRTALDAALSESGHRQADSTAQNLASLGPLPLWSSPLQQARQTAAALASLW
jgi:broad specificity phosphatase PhoE